MTSLRAFFALLLVLGLAGCSANPSAGDGTVQPDDLPTETAPGTVPDDTATVTSEAPAPPPADEATATAEPPATAVPTPTEETLPTVAQPEMSPAPPGLSEMGAWLDAAVSGGATLEEARSALLEEGWIESEADFRAAPLRGTGDEVWVIRAVRPVAEGETPLTALLPGAVFMVDPAAEGVVYEQFGQAAIGAEETFFPAPTVLTDTDFTGDGTLDLLFRLTNCGASTCYDEYHIVSYHESETPEDVIRAAGYTADGQFSEEMPFATMSFSDAYIGDRTGDSISDLYLGGGTQGSVGAGPQRARFETYAWDGEHVELAQTEYEESQFRYFRLVDANRAFDEADYETARNLYEEVLERPDLVEPSHWFTAEEERSALDRYATYRLVLLDILEEDYIGAQRRAEEMAAANPDDPISTGALETVMTFARTNSLSDACAAFTASVEGVEPDPIAPLDDMGYGNPSLGAETLCPL